MPIAVDGSSPARFTGTPANGAAITSASFEEVSIIAEKGEFYTLSGAEKPDS